MTKSIRTDIAISRYTSFALHTSKPLTQRELGRWESFLTLANDVNAEINAEDGKRPSKALRKAMAMYIRHVCDEVASDDYGALGDFVADAATGGESGRTVDGCFAVVPHTRK